MTSFDNKTGTSSNPARSDLPSSQLPFSTDFSPFLNWNEEEIETESEKAVVFRSLVATVKLQSALDDSLEAKTVKFLESVDAKDEDSADAFLASLASMSDNSPTDFVQSIVVLISSTNQAITTTAMEMLDSLIWNCSKRIRLSLVKADLIPRLINTLNPLSLSFAEAVDIHTDLMRIIFNSLWLASPDGLSLLEIEYDDEQQDVQETILKQVVAPSEKHICHLCVNRYSIIDGDQSASFLRLLARLLEISSSYQPTMEFVLHMPVFLTIPSCLTFFEKDSSIWTFLDVLIDIQRECDEEMREERQMWKKIQRMLRMEGIEDAIEEKLRNDRNGRFGVWMFLSLIEWNNLLGMNLPELW
ncbi:hypothetical protein BLNAU_11966 [Blattamonas nauphoetae]|uniref:Uncharacterized protein n=1 Tax=Blattamonas nauphoetae TaxID=2049346 RepID=A0ABQ9XQN6_9EUKA|nr:hypothetical protein BLNAU_11966 [Blattamonas nauphoetae]